MNLGELLYPTIRTVSTTMTPLTPPTPPVFGYLPHPYILTGGNRRRPWPGRTDRTVRPRPGDNRGCSGCGRSPTSAERTSCHLATDRCDRGYSSGVQCHRSDS